MFVRKEPSARQVQTGERKNRELSTKPEREAWVTRQNGKGINKHRRKPLPGETGKKGKERAEAE